MRNTLILVGQIRQNEKDGLSPFDAVVEATVQRSRPVILTALAADAGVHSAHALGVLGNAGVHA